MFSFLKKELKKINYTLIYTFAILVLLSTQSSIASNEELEIKNVHILLQNKKFVESINSLEELSLKNNIKAQLLYSKILFSGNIIPQDFKKSYLWATSALLGGLKNANSLTNKLNSYLTDEQLEPIEEDLRVFLEKRAFTNDKRAIIQIAKFYEIYPDPPDIINAYTWYSIAVAKGIKSATQKRDVLLKELNEKDLLEAQIISNKLFKQIKINGD